MDAAPEWTARAPALHIIAYIACVGMANIILHEPTPCRNCPVPTRLSLAALSHSRPRPRTRIPISSAYPLLPILSCCCVVQLGAVQQAGRPAALHYTHTHRSPAAIMPSSILTAVATPITIALVLPAAWADPLRRRLELSAMQWTRVMYSNGAYVVCPTSPGQVTIHSFSFLFFLYDCRRHKV